MIVFGFFLGDSLYGCEMFDGFWEFNGGDGGIWGRLRSGVWWVCGCGVWGVFWGSLESMLVGW